jgi:hypothetical protein
VARASMSAPCSPPARRESRAEVCAHRCSARSPAAVEVLLVLREGEARGKRLAVSDLHLLRHYPTVAEHRRRRIRRARRQFLARRCCSGQGGGWTWCGVWYQVSGSAGSSMNCVKLRPTWVVFWCGVSRAGSVGVATANPVSGLVDAFESYAASDTQPPAPLHSHRRCGVDRAVE